MKVKCIHQKTFNQKYFFFLMIAPLLIGLMITFTSLAHAQWNKKDDPCLHHSPQSQGWALLGERDLSLNVMKSQEKTLKTAAR